MFSIIVYLEYTSFSASYVKRYSTESPIVILLPPTTMYPPVSYMLSI